MTGEVQVQKSKEVLVFFIKKAKKDYYESTDISNTTDSKTYKLQLKPH